MKVCLIGGIYGTAVTASGYLRITPETTLEAGLRAAGHEVVTMSHYAAADFSSFDVVHVHHLSYGAARLASDPSSSPFVFTVHDASEMNGARLSPARAAALRYVQSRADRVVALSRTEAEFRQARYGISASRLATIPNGIDPAQFPFRRRNRAGRGQPWRLVFVGQLIELKGCDLILRAVAALKQDVVLTLAYQTSDLEASLKALASSLGIAHRVIFAGRQEPWQLAELYQSSDLLVMASETEALPSVITEAMFSGLPFVATRVGGVPTQAGGFGRLIERRTVEELRGGIEAVLSEYEKFQGAGEAMSRCARRAYSVSSMVSGHASLYGELVGTRPRRLAFGLAPVNCLVRTAVNLLGTHSNVGTLPSAAKNQTITEKS